MSLKLHLLELIGIEKLDQILQGFTAVTGVASIIADPEGHPITRAHNFTPLCQKYCRSTLEGKKKCCQSDRYGGTESARMATPPIYPCLNAGLLDCAAPVIVGGCHLATVLCGQVLEEPMRQSVAVDRARAIGVTNIEGYLEELGRVPVMSRNRLLDVANLMSVITKTISELALGTYQLHRQSREYLHQVINAVSDCIISTDAQGIVSMVNEAGAAMFGSKSQDLIGQPMEKLFSGRDLGAECPALRMGDWKRESRHEMTAVRGDSRQFPVQVSVSEIHESHEDSPDYVAVIRDITEEKRIDRMKEDLIGMVMHDIRNPVLSLQKAMQLLVDETMGPLNANQLEIIRLSLGTSHQLFGMASNLLDIYRNENGQLLLVKSPIDIGQVMTEAISQLEFFAKDKRVSLVFETQGRCLRLFGDQRRLLRVCVNLLDNVVKYSPEEGEVRLSCRRIGSSELTEFLAVLPAPAAPGLKPDRDHILTSIADQGIGIPREYHTMVFDKFFTVESRAPSERKGVGLGLAFCKQVIEAHEGQIWVRSPLYNDERGQERGCELSFLLPAGDPIEVDRQRSVRRAPPCGSVVLFA